MVSKEKLVDGGLESILGLLRDTRYGEHNVVIYPNLDSFREIYTHLTKARIENNNDRVLILPHYETERSVEQALMELDMRAKEQIEKGSLEIMDSQHAFFDPAQRFPKFVEAAAKDALRNGKGGVVIIADMGAFFHRQDIEQLLSHECGMASQCEGSKFTIFCCYHIKDFQKLTKEHEARMCENHYRNLFVTESSIK